jgi:SAM-dependent methyltransferase
MGLLRHPLTRDLDIDDPRSTLLRRRIIAEKAFLRQVYTEWYRAILAELPAPCTHVLEIGSGAGFLKELLPQVVTSEVFALEGVDRVEDATALSFADASLDAIVMTDVLHHIPDVAAFLCEAARTLRLGGRLVMSEPWRTPWSEWFYRNLHHEPFEPGSPTWTLPAGGPLSSANGALPWIVFERDRDRLAREHPELSLLSVTPSMPLAYLVSGGVSLRALVPGGAYRGVRALERRVLRERGAMFALIVVERVAG